MTLFLGIDGGGSSLRAVIMDSNHRVVARAETETANPSVIGWDEAAVRLQQTMIQVLNEASIQARQIAGVGVGIAGASATHAADWINRTCSVILPESLIVPASDFEVALVGAHGQRAGGIIVAGTGSVGFCIDANGNEKQIGGWGYLIGDEGSGYWIGRQALSLLSCCFDGTKEYSEFVREVIGFLKIEDGKSLIAWLYKQSKPPVRQIAQLAPIVLAHAEAGDQQAVSIIQGAVEAIVQLAAHLQNYLPVTYRMVALYGGLLQNDTLLRHLVIQQLTTENVLIHYQYPADVGAALLAQLRYEEHAN